MINLDLTEAEGAALATALGVVENVNEHLTAAETSADAKLTAALAGEPPSELATDRYPEQPAAGTWDAYPPLSDETARLMLHEILFDAGFMLAAIDCADSPAGVTVLDALEAFRGNCWDDQHDGGAHRQDLIDVNRLFSWLGPIAGPATIALRDPFAEVHGLVSDDAPDDERWAQR